MVLRIRPYCRLGAVRNTSLHPFADEGQHQLLTRISWQKGLTRPANSLGGNFYRLIRYRFQSGNSWQAGWLMESDAGESVRRSGPDFISAYVNWKRTGGRLNWLLGDYSVQMGQGLICWQGMTFGPGTDLPAIKRQGVSVRPYQSVGEGRFLRGVAVSASTRKVSWDVFISRNPQTAPRYSLLDGRVGFRQVDVSGYHRTAMELAKKDRLIEYTAGGRMGSRFHGGRWNINWIGRCWSIPQFFIGDLRRVDTSWQVFRSNASADVSFTRGSLHAFGEMAVDARGRLASVLGAVVVLDRRVDWSIHLRWIGNAFRSVDGQAFQHASTGTSERGGYTQLRFRINDRQLLDVYSDMYFLPRPGFFSSTPSFGLIQGGRWQYQPDKRNLLYLRFQWARSDRDDDARPLPRTSIHTSRSLRLHGQFDLGAKQSLSVRAEKIMIVAKEGPDDETGFLAYLEWKKEPEKSGVGLDVRLLWVSTDGWASRIYAYERDVLYKAGFPAFFGKQLRGYLNASAPIGQRAMIWVHLFVDKKIDYHWGTDFVSPIEPGATVQFRYQWDVGRR